MPYETLKALHLIFIVTWFAGLFYIVRLFIYHAEALEKPQQERDILVGQFLIMERRLWYGITWPSALLVAIFGFSLILEFMPLRNHLWLQIKLGFLICLYCYHFYCGQLVKRFKQGSPTPSSSWLRVYNEVATLLLIAIVFLAVSKSHLVMGKALIGLTLLSAVLMVAIKMYKRLRKT
jgi:putative membrane protein